MSSLPTGIYQHYKGNKYLVLGVAKHSETLEDMVVYVALYDNDLTNLWVRPLTMFTQQIEVKGKRVPRFREMK